MTNEEFKRLRELAQAATPGPWRWGERGPQSFKLHGGPDRRTVIHSGPFEIGGPDRAFIAAANPQAVLTLLDEVERLNGLARQFHADMWSAERQRDEARTEVERLRKLVNESTDLAQHAIANLDTENDEGLASNAYNAVLRLAAIRKEAGL